eukprot:GGOE01014793.1.p1 GENE.GGOE01014793.1~~GGOE01014793.1.p1  ORF type:complete len:1442 (-),score=454.41 GGOE01014793.1:175-4254(-)
MEQRRQQQAQLPIYQHKEPLLQTIQERRVTIIAGSCGCGKSTQVAQYILDAHILRGKRVNILVTQPRRLAATSIAARVAKERGIKLGGEVGFMIGNRTNYCSHTKLKFVTTGVLQKILLHQRTLKEYTHIIMDEVHERTSEIDIVAACLKQILHWNQHLRVVIMSATIDCTHFAQYFAGHFPRCTQVPGEVLEEWKADTEEDLSETEQLLQRLIDILDPALAPTVEHMTHIAEFEAAMRTAPAVPKELEQGLVKLGWSTGRYEFIEKLDKSRVVDVMMVLRDLFENVANDRRQALEDQRMQADQVSTPNAAEEDADLLSTRRPDPVEDPAPVISVTTVRPFKVKLFFLEDALAELNSAAHKQILQPPLRPSVSEERKEYFFTFFRFLHQTKFSDPEHTFLVFLPGSLLIEEFHSKLHALFGAELDLHTLHSMVPIEDQQQVMLPSECGKRKVILSTNIAESSITVPNVKVVLDLCLAKEVRWKADLHSPTLDDVWVSQSSAEQRTGRAGRVCDGEVYRWVSRLEYRRFPHEQESQLRQQPLDTLVLQVLQMQWGDPDFLLARTIDPPDRSNVAASYQLLRDVGAVVCTGTPLDSVLDNQQERVTEEAMSSFKGRYQVTKIGRVLASLKCGTLPGILILYGSVFGVLEECLVMASIVEKGSPIQASRNASKVAQARAVVHYAMESQSDLIAGLHAYRFWRRCAMRKVFPPEDEAKWCEQNDLSLYHLREIEDSVVQFKEDLAPFHYCLAPSAKQKRRIRQHRRAVLPGTVEAMLEAAAAENAKADDDGEEEAEDVAPANVKARASQEEVLEEITNTTDDYPQGANGLGCPQKTSELIDMDEDIPTPQNTTDTLQEGQDTEDLEDPTNLLDPEDDLAKVLAKMGTDLEAKRAVGLDPSKEDPYRKQGASESSNSESQDGAANEEEDSEASDMEGRAPLPSVPLGQPLPVPRDVRLPDCHLRLLPMLIAGAFMAHMHAVQLSRVQEEDGWTLQERTSHMVEFRDFSRDLRNGDATFVVDILRQQHIARQTGRHAPVPVDIVKKATLRSSGSMCVVFESDRNPKRMQSKFCDRFPLSVRLSPLSATPSSCAKPEALSWRTVRHHPHHAATAVPIFHKKVKVELDRRSVAQPLLLLNKEEDEEDVVTLIPASLQGRRSMSSLHARHNTILYGAGKRELVLLVFHRELEVESCTEAPAIVQNLLKVRAKLRGECEEFYLQLHPALQQDVIALRNFINRSIMIPMDSFEDNKLLATDLEELEAELQKLTLQDKVAAFVQTTAPTASPHAPLDRDHALERMLYLECECDAAKPGRFKKRWINPRIVKRHTVAAQSSLLLNQRLMRASQDRSIYRNSDLLTPAEMDCQ